jgi:hypothetical protein
LSAINRNKRVGWLRENKVDIGLKIILFLISPFLSFFYSLKTLKARSSYVIFFLVALFFGMALTFPKGQLIGSTFDGSYYRESFEQYKTESYYNYLDGLRKFFTFNKGKQDYYFETVAFFVSRITNNYHVMFLTFAFVFAFFSLKTFKFLTSENNFTSSLSCFILAYLFMTNQIFNINGVRFWTAAWIGVYCIFQIFRNGNIGYFLLAFCTPFVHGSFWVFIAVLLLAYFLRRFEKIWIVLFFISFLVSSISVEIITDASSYLPPFLQNLIHSYSSKEAIAKFNQPGEGFSWVAMVFNFLVRLYINLMVYLFIKNSDKIKANSKSKDMYTFLLVYITFVNFAMPIPSLGVRYMVLAYPIIAYIWLVNFKGRQYKQVLYVMPVVFWFAIYTQINHYLNVLQFDFYVSNPFFLFYKYLIS